MKKIYKITFLLFFVFQTVGIQAQTIWTGPTMTFTKENNADWNLEENQDRITDNVWITRKNNQGIFNIVTESNYEDFLSPADTEWAYGTTDDIATLTFNNWEDTHESNPPSMVNQDMVLHLITDDVYMNIKFTSWSGGGSGGGFTYERATNNMSVNDIALTNSILISPNPTTDEIQFSGLKQAETIAIYNTNGKLLLQKEIQPDETVDVQRFSKGIYFIRLNSGKVVKFIKE